jgi:hypothetical protein
MEEQKKDLPQSESQAPKTQAPTEAPAEQPTAPVVEQELVFNIMPEVKNQGGVVEAKVKVESQTTEPEKPKMSLDSLAKYKWYLIGGIGLLVAGVGAYFLLGKIGSSGYESENLLVQTQPPVNHQQPKPEATTHATSQEWRDKYFTGCEDTTICGDEADPDHDGLTNAEEFKEGTDPNNQDSDQDGLSDGDELRVFSSNPLSSHTANNAKFSDADYIKGGYDFKTDKKMMPAQIAEISAKMKEHDLHSDTVITLSDYLTKVYKFTPAVSTSTASNTIPSTTNASTTIDQSLEAKQDRDAQRTNTIKNIEIALVKYQADNKTYPTDTDFNSMFTAIKPYLKVAANPKDPLNRDPFIYIYTADPTGADFTLSFFSEVAGQIIKKHAVDAAKDSKAAEAAIYDDQRTNDLESLRTALLLYSQQNTAGNEDYVFPKTDKYKTALVPTYISQIPRDPKTQAEYEYQVSTTFNTFTLKAVLDNPDPGTTGFLCNQDECKAY